MRKTKITKITVETHRRVVIRKTGGQTGGDNSSAREIVERPARKNIKEMKPHD